MFTRIEIGRIAGIPIYLDMMFVLVLLVFTYPYFTSGSTQAMSAGFVIIVGLLLSILLHELGHAFAGRLFRAHVSHIELTGLGGLAHFERTLPRSVFARSVIYLAGPAVNLGLWLGLDWLVVEAAGAGKGILAQPLAVLAWANLVLMVFNLLPAYPLDGGQTLDAWLGAVLGPVWSVRIVASLGLVCAAGLVYLAFPRSIFLLLVALFLAMANWQKLQSLGRWQR
jgi:Zn-dependent protease